MLVSLTLLNPGYELVTDYAMPPNFWNIFLFVNIIIIMLKGYELAKMAAAHKPLLIDRSSPSSLELVRQLFEKKRFTPEEVEFFSSRSEVSSPKLGLGDRIRQSKLLGLCHFS